jgi:hypothetical protein
MVVTEKLFTVAWDSPGGAALQYYCADRPKNSRYLGASQETMYIKLPIWQFIVQEKITSR